MEEIRLNKYLSEQGVCSRREADRLIEAGKVTIDGRRAEMGEKVTGQERIICDGKPVGKAAGSKKVLELHGSILRSYCSVCGKPYPADKMNHGAGVPHCTCGGVIRPDIVLYEEPLDENIVTEAVRAISEAEVLIIGGTSLNVYPAAGLINYYRGNKLALVNLSSTPYDDRADLVIHEKIGKVFSQL